MHHSRQDRGTIRSVREMCLERFKRISTNETIEHADHTVQIVVHPMHDGPKTSLRILAVTLSHYSTGRRLGTNAMMISTAFA